ncbi:hypothetical protein B0J14DRAFT_599725 [Halenospora varia]|nr:hypothetical protein B0J14DRAFT_599725 [Halenospora varia]
MYTGVTRGAQVTGIAVMALSLTWISVTLRFYVRMGILKFIGREDWLMIAAMYIFICELLYVSCTAVTKLSIGVYFLRLSSKKYQVRVVYTTLAVVMIFSTMYFFFLLFQCDPINHLWTQFMGGEGKCLHNSILSNVTYAHAAMSAITDWAFGILPIFFVRKMQMNPRTKFSVVLILSLGFFASSATIVRIVYIKSLTETEDWSWEGINLVKWSMVEPAIAITASNIATLRPMFKNFFLGGHASTQDYSIEFAQMLGLSRARVTTKISAGGRQPERDQRKRFSMSRRGFRERSESQTQLHSIPALPEGSDGMDWNSGIKITTTTTIQA